MVGNVKKNRYRIFVENKTFLISLMMIIGYKIYLVVGGIGGNYLSTTETWSPGDSSWTTVSPLPRTVAYAGAVTLDNNIFLFGLYK